MKRRRWFELHSWIGIITGLMMFLICWSGTVAVLSHEIDWLLDGRQRATGQIAQVPSPAAWGIWAASVRAAYPEAKGITLHAPLASGFSAQAVLDTPEQSMKRVFLDPATGQVMGESSYFNVQRFFRSLHMSLFDLGSDRTWGYWFVAAFAPLLVVSSLAPLIFYRRWWRGFLTLKRDRGPRVFWSDFHKLSGVWSLLFTWLIALTSLWYLAEWFDVDFGYPVREPVEATHPAPSPLPVETLVAHAQKHWPGLEFRSVGLPEGSYWGNVLYLEGQADAWLVRDRANYLMIDTGTGTPLRRQDIRSVGWPERWVDTADPLHFGNFAGLPLKVVWFVFGLALSGLCLTGAYLHAKRLQSESSSRRAGWRGTRSAMVISVVAIGLAGWGAWKELLRYGPTVNGQMTFPDVPLGVSLFLVAWCLVTLAILVAWMFLVESGPRTEPRRFAQSVASRTSRRGLSGQLDR